MDFEKALTQVDCLIKLLGHKPAHAQIPYEVNPVVECTHCNWIFHLDSYSHRADYLLRINDEPAVWINADAESKIKKLKYSFYCPKLQSLF